jgi:hypothetical protein
MQRFLILNEDQAKLVLDNINFKILELLVSEELNATSLSEKIKGSFAYFMEKAK